MKRRTCQNGGKSFAIEKISEQYSMKFGFLVKHTPRDLEFRDVTKSIPKIVAFLSKHVVTFIDETNHSVSSIK